MIRTLCLLFLTTLLGYADAPGPNDKFDLALTSVKLIGSKMEFIIKVTNQSAAPVSIDQKCEIVVIKASAAKSGTGSEAVNARPGIYKPRLTVIVPDDAPLLGSLNNQGRVFAPGLIAPGQSLTLDKTVAWPTNYSIKNASSPLSAYVTLAYRSDTKADLNLYADKSSPPSPTYKLTENAAGTIDISVAP